MNMAVGSCTSLILLQHMTNGQGLIGWSGVACHMEDPGYLQRVMRAIKLEFG